jgi:hypothetical protein
MRLLMEAEAARLSPGQVDLWPRIAGQLARQRRRARRRRMALTSSLAALVAIVWIGVAPVGGWLPGAANTVVPTAQAAEMTPGPAAAVVASTAVPAPAPTATATITPLPSR